jgi:hypothetical protein
MQARALISPFTGDNMRTQILNSSSTLPTYVIIGSCHTEATTAADSERWARFITSLGMAVAQCEIEPHAFVVMSDHVHLLMTAPLGNLRTALALITMEGGSAGAVGRCEGQPTFRSINSAVRFAYVYQQIYRKPVQGGLCPRVQDYPWSSLATAKRIRQIHSIPEPPALFPAVGFNQFVPLTIWEELEWLNNLPLLGHQPFTQPREFRVG